MLNKEEKMRLLLNCGGNLDVARQAAEWLEEPSGKADRPKGRHLQAQDADGIWRYAAADEVLAGQRVRVTLPGGYVDFGGGRTEAVLQYASDANAAGIPPFIFVLLPVDPGT